MIKYLKSISLSFKINSVKINFGYQNFFTFLTIIYYIVFVEDTFSQNIRFNRISIEHGLSQSSVNSMMQDSKGLMWFGTQDGLNRFDGITFKVFKNNPNNPNSLSDNYINCIYEDQSGILWIGTMSNGLNRFDVATMQFIHYQNNPGNPASLSNNTINCIHQDKLGLFWIGTRNGLNRFDPAANQFIYYKNDSNNPASLSNNTVNCVYEDKIGNIWIGTEYGLNQLDRTTGNFTCFQYETDNINSISNNFINSICEDSSKQLWIGTRNGLNMFNRSTKRFVHYQHNAKDENSLSNNIVRIIFTDHAGVLWIGTESGGLNRFDPKLQNFTHFKHDPHNIASLSDNNVVSIFEDRSDVFWIGTVANGINQLYSKKKGFRLYQSDPEKSDNLTSHQIHSIYEDHQGSLWIGTSDGLNSFNLSRNQITNYQHFPEDFNSISKGYIFAIYEDPDEVGKVIWIGTFGGGLNQFDSQTKRFKKYQHNSQNPNSLSNDFIYYIYEDRQEEFWIGTRKGLNRFDRQTGQFEHYTHDIKNPNSLSNDYVYNIYEDHSGLFWVGTGNGLNLLNRSTNQFTRFKNDPDNPESLSNNRVFCIYEDRNNNLWIGTQGGGLNLFHPENHQFKRYTEEDGLSNNSIYGILEDDNENLWISTNNGLSKFNTQTKKFKNYYASDGLQSNEFNTASYYKSRSGEMFFGGINGLNSFFPDSIKDNTNIPQIVITDFKIFNKPVSINYDGSSPLKRSITDTKEIILSYKDNIFSFEYAALDYVSPEKNEYAYMLEGLESDWNYVGNRRFVTYTTLPPGDYIFRIKGSNNDHVWNEQGTSLKITITPPFWQTTWFRILIIIMVGLIIFIIYQIRTRTLRERNRMLEERVAERTLSLETVNEELEKLSIVARETDNAITIMDSNTNFLWVNEGFNRLHGYTLEEFIKEKGENLLRASTNPDIKKAVHDCINNKASVIYESYNITKKNEKNWTQTTLTPVLDDNGEVSKLVTIEADIWKLKEAQEEAEEATRAKSVFLANMSHEIRTPMNGVIGMTSLLLDTPLNDEQIDFTQTIQISADTLLTLINDILDFSKIEAGKLDLEVLDFNLRSVIEEVGDLLSLKAEEKGIEFTCLVYHDVPSYLQGDPGRLRQILINLSNNAIKFTSKGEVVIHVSVEKENESESTLQFRVSDTGIGIPQNRISKLFKSFSQVDSSTTRQYGGTGLGLAISNQLVGMMNGEIGVESEEGKGSTFWFTAVFQKQPEDQIVIRASHKEISKLHILIVDDNRTNRRVLKEQLKLWGCSFDEAASGQEALDKLKAEVGSGRPFNIVILDMLMHRMNGETLGEKIKADSELKNTILIMITSSAQRGEASKMKEIGFAAYLTKPIKHAQLYDCLMKVLGKKKVDDDDDRPILTEYALTKDEKQNARILLAEDNITNQKVALHILERMGFSADAVSNGKEAVKALETIPYDLVLMDVQMPEMDGFEATRVIRDPETKVKNHEIPVIAMTAHAMEKDRDRCLEIGMDDYVSKPVKPKELSDVLEKQLSHIISKRSLAIKKAKSMKIKIFDHPSLLERFRGDESFIMNLVDDFICDFSDKKEQLEQAINKNDSESVSKIAHSMKGACLNIAAPVLSEVTAAIEQISKNKDLNEIVSLLTVLENDFDKFKNVTTGST